MNQPRPPKDNFPVLRYLFSMAEKSARQTSPWKSGASIVPTFGRFAHFVVGRARVVQRINRVGESQICMPVSFSPSVVICGQVSYGRFMHCSASVGNVSISLSARLPAETDETFQSNMFSSFWTCPSLLCNCATGGSSPHRPRPRNVRNTWASWACINGKGGADSAEVVLLSVRPFVYLDVF